MTNDIYDYNDKFFCTALRYISIALVITGAILIILSFTNIIPLNQLTYTLLVLASFICAFTINKSIAHPKLRFYSIIIFSIYINTLGAIQEFPITILYLEPILLSLYTSNKKSIIKIAAIHTLLFLVSIAIRTEFIAYGFSKLDSKNLKYGKWLALLRSSLELLIVLVTLIPFAINLFKQNTILANSLANKEKATSEILLFCSTATAYHDKYLYVHIQNVKRITQVILDTLRSYGHNISNELYNNIILSVQFHDIGKIYIHPNILEKNGKLDEDEFNIIKEHPKKGLDLFCRLPSGVLTSEQESICKHVIVQHHERLDGSGYPNGLKDKEISFEARIIAIADVVDALLSWRPYKKPMTWNKMTTILLENISKYDSSLVEIILTNKEKILQISDEGNEKIKEIMNITDNELVRNN